MVAVELVIEIVVVWVRVAVEECDDRVAVVLFVVSVVVVAVLQTSPSHTCPT